MRQLLAVLLVAAIAPAALPAQQTPLERADHARLTSHAELVAFVDSVASGDPRITVRTLGHSLEGRRIPYLEISEGELGSARGEKPIVLVFAQQHGNEPSGMEAALSLLRDVATGRHDDLLRSLDLLLVPQVNPDGGERHLRQNAAGVDLNRSHLVLDGHEVRLLRELFHAWEPEVAVDVHEYQPWSGAWLQHGYIRLFDEQYGTPTNLNVAEPIRRLANEHFLPHVDRFLAQRGFTHHEYIIGSPELIRYSTSDINDGRQGFAILGTFGLILEGKRSREEAGRLERRTEGQRAALEGLLTFVAENREEVLGAVRETRSALRERRMQPFVAAMTRARGSTPLEIPVETVREGPAGWERTGDTITAAIAAYYPIVSPERTVDLPEAYLVPGEMAPVIELLHMHRVEVLPLAPGRELEVERYVLGEREEVDLVETTVTLPPVEIRRERYRTRAGDVYVPVGQLRGMLVAIALEPESMHGLHRYPAFSDLLMGGDRYPILRIPAAD
jgi:hypothetical protein